MTSMCVPFYVLCKGITSATGAVGNNCCIRFSLLLRLHFSTERSLHSQFNINQDDKGTFTYNVEIRLKLPANFTFSSWELTENYFLNKATVLSFVEIVQFRIKILNVTDYTVDVPLK